MSWVNIIKSNIYWQQKRYCAHVFRKSFLSKVSYMTAVDQILTKDSSESTLMGSCLPYMHFLIYHFYTPVSRRAILCDWVWWAAGGRPHRSPHNNFSSVYRLFTKLSHMIPLYKGKNLFILGSLGQRSRSPLL
jgi:hypothetical protein